jgi:DNA replication protein DnaC
MPEPRALEAIDGILARRGIATPSRDPGAEAAYDQLAAEETANELLAARRELANDWCTRNIPPRWADARADHPAVTAWTIAYLADPARVPSLLLHGGTGTGKTHQAFGAMRTLAAAGHHVAWTATTTANLFASLRPRTGVDTEAVFDRYATAPLLMLDDLGAAKASEWTEEITYRLIDHRYGQCLPAIFTTNLLLQALRDSLGDRIASRLMEMTTPVKLAGDDRRAVAAGATVRPIHPAA